MRLLSRTRSAFTLAETMVVCGLTVIAGGMAFIVLNTGLTLFAKNTAVNVAHQEARMAMLKMEQELHSAVAPLQFIDEDGSTVSGNAPAAGVQFRLFSAGPFKVASDAAAGQKNITVDLGTNFQAKAGQRLIIQSHEIELDIVSNSVGSGIQTLTLEKNLPNAVKTKDPALDTEKNVYALILDRVSYRVKDGELKYRGRDGAEVVMARDITSDKPFTRSKKGSGNANENAIAAINLSTGKKGNKKKYKSANMFLTAEIPARATLCTEP